jgi:acetylornithine deacetylase/succinyl-diaminopimelate desuccinylase-like protein
MTLLSDYLDRHRQDFENDLCELLRIPSVSADSRHRDDIRRAAMWVHERLAAAGLSAELIEGPGHPLVYAESAAVPGAPTALVYGHYDVQPPDPLHEWITPPFEPTVRDGNIYARGATDDKGQMLTHVQSVRAWLEVAGKLPLQVKFLIEGEEEVGGRVLEQYLRASADRLACDCVVISDTSQFAPGQPAITYGLRGIIYCEARLQGPKQDLHSGVFGGAVSNPAGGLAKLLASLKDDAGRVLVPGFYDDVLPLSDREREQFAALPFDEARFKAQLGVSELWGESGYSTLERRWARPCLDVNGIWGGYQGEGQKTVLPSTAGAKFSFRLVPNQDPAKIVPALREYLESRLPPGLEMELEVAHTAPGFVVPLESPYIEAAARAVEAGFDKPPVFIREGGSIPIVTQLARQLGADVLLLGWGRDDDNTHSPNEKFSLADFHRGIRASAALWEELAKIPPG